MPDRAIPELVKLSPSCTGTQSLRYAIVLHDGDSCPVHEAQTPDGRWDRVLPTLVVVHKAKRKTGLPAGTVERDGRIIGRVWTRTRTKGGVTRPFWNAAPSYPFPEWSEGPTLGTRFETRKDALAALRAFDTAYPPHVIAKRITSWDHDWQWVYFRAILACMREFKRAYARGF